LCLTLRRESPVGGFEPSTGCSLEWTMSSLYLMEQGLLVRQSGERLILYRDKERIAEVPLMKIGVITGGWGAIRFGDSPSSAWIRG
jgi:hypothetical protein